jgi:hypothetical protein
LLPYYRRKLHHELTLEIFSLMTMVEEILKKIKKKVFNVLWNLPVRKL